MLKVISRRINRKDEGFTLIELMVVLVVIGILMAIAIPTFLGAKNKANDRAAQENVRNALTAEKTYYTDNQAYVAGDLSSIEPTLKWNTNTAAIPTSPAGNPVFVRVASTNGTNDNVMIEAPSASGGCVYIDDEAVASATPATGLAAGTYFTAKTTACGTANDPTAPTTLVTPGTKGTGGTWGTSW